MTPEQTARMLAETSDYDDLPDEDDFGEHCAHCGNQIEFGVGANYADAWCDVCPAVLCINCTAKDSAITGWTKSTTRKVGLFGGLCGDPKRLCPLHPQISEASDYDDLPDEDDFGDPTMYYVDIPTRETLEGDQPWANVFIGATQEEAVAWIKENIGNCDGQGRIGLITES